MQEGSREILKKKGFKATDGRVAILDVFTKTDAPQDAEAIYRAISGKLKGINEATVYRNLSALADGGILKRVDLRKDSAYFELAEHHHHHIVCTGCNMIEDFENTELEKILEKLTRGSSKFKNITEHSLELFGLCAKCA